MGHQEHGFLYWVHIYNGTYFKNYLIIPATGPSYTGKQWNNTKIELFWLSFWGVREKVSYKK